MSEKKTRPSRQKKSQPKAEPKVSGLAFGPVNYAVFAAGLASIVGGYVLLDQGSVTAAPVLLILGYAVLLPAGLVLGWRRLG